MRARRRVTCETFRRVTLKCEEGQLRHVCGAVRSDMQFCDEASAVPGAVPGAVAVAIPKTTHPPLCEFKDRAHPVMTRSAILRVNQNSVWQFYVGQFYVTQFYGTQFYGTQF